MSDEKNCLFSLATPPDPSPILKINPSSATDCDCTHDTSDITQQNFKLTTLTYKALASESIAYLSSLLSPYDLVRIPRSSDQLLLRPFPTKTNFDLRAFRSAAPSIWNSLPYPVRASPTLFPLNELSKLTISSLPFTRPTTSRLHYSRASNF